jgi:signal transduction histidine kinase
VRIEDNGTGFDAEYVLSGGTPGIGLESIKERVLNEGGTLGVASGDTGTAISIEIPIGGSS